MNENIEFEFQIVAEPTSQVAAENVSSTGREQENSKRPEEPAVPV